MGILCGIFVKHGLKNDKITLQIVVTLGMASQSWSRTKSGGQTYTLQFTGTGRHAFSFKGNRQKMVKSLFNLIKILSGKKNGGSLHQLKADRRSVQISSQPFDFMIFICANLIWMKF